MQIVAKAGPEVAKPLAWQPDEREDKAIVLAFACHGVLPFVWSFWGDEVEEGALPVSCAIVGLRFDVARKQAHQPRLAQAAFLADLAHNRRRGVFAVGYRAAWDLYARLRMIAVAESEHGADVIRLAGDVGVRLAYHYHTRLIDRTGAGQNKSLE